MQIYFFLRWGGGGGMGMIPVYLLGIPESYWVVVVLGGRGLVFLPA